MVNELRPALSQAEREVLQDLWEHGPGTVREIGERLGPREPAWAYSTVITLLGRLEKKGYVAIDKSSFAHVFHAGVTRDQVVRQRLADVAEELCDGATTPLVLALVEGQRFTAAEIEEFRRLIDRLERQRGGKSKPKPRR